MISNLRLKLLLLNFVIKFQLNFYGKIAKIKHRQYKVLYSILPLFLYFNIVDYRL